MTERLVKSKTHDVHSMDPTAVMTADAITLSLMSLPVEVVNYTTTGHTVAALPGKNYQINATVDHTHTCVITLPDHGAEYDNPVDPSVKYQVGNGDTFIFDIIAGDVTIQTDDAGAHTYTHSPGAREGTESVYRVIFKMIGTNWHMVVNGQAPLLDTNINRRNTVNSIFANIGVLRMASVFTGDLEQEQITYNSQLGLFWVNNGGGKFTAPAANIVFNNGSLIGEQDGFEWVPFKTDDTVASEGDPVDQYKLFIPGSFDTDLIYIIQGSDITDLNGYITKDKIIDGANIPTTSEKATLDEIISDFPSVSDTVTQHGITLADVQSALSGLATTVSELSTAEKQVYIDGVTVISEHDDGEDFALLAYSKSYTPESGTDLTFKLPDEEEGTDRSGYVIVVRTDDTSCTVLNSDDGSVAGGTYPVGMADNGVLLPNQTATFIRPGTNVGWICLSRTSNNYAGIIENIVLTGYNGVNGDSGMQHTEPGVKEYTLNLFEGVGLVSDNLIEIMGHIEILGANVSDTNTVTFRFSDSFGELSDTASFYAISFNHGASANFNMYFPFSIPIPKGYNTLEVTIVRGSGCTVRFRPKLARQLV